MSDNDNSENSNLRISIDTNLADTIDSVSKVIPNTLAALDRMGESILTIGSFPLLITKEYAPHCIEKTRKKLRDKLNEIPQEQLHPAPPYIAIPLMQDMFIYADYDVLHDMFIHLLATSMNSTMDTAVHPAFVNVIKNLSPSDATALTSSVFRKPHAIPVYEARFQKKHSGLPDIHPLPFPLNRRKEGISLYNHLINLDDVLPYLSVSEVETIVDNLYRQGLITINPEREFSSLDIYQKDMAFLKNLHLIMENRHSTKSSPDSENAIVPMVGTLTSFGQRFLASCVY